CRPLYALPYRGDDLKAVTFAGNDWLVSADKEQRVGVWEARTGKAVRQFDHGGPVQILAASADGRLLATLEHHTHSITKLLERDVVHVWDLTTGTRKHTLAARPGSWFLGVRLTPDGRRVLAWSFYGTGRELTVWDAAS